MKLRSVTLLLTLAGCGGNEILSQEIKCAPLGRGGSSICQPARDMTVRDLSLPRDIATLCGNKLCGPGETCANCPADCPCPDMTPLACPNNICGPGETCANCPADCGGPCPPPADLSVINDCGNQLCGPGETCVNCPLDCGPCRDMSGPDLADAGYAAHPCGLAYAYGERTCVAITTPNGCALLQATYAACGYDLGSGGACATALQACRADH